MGRGAIIDIAWKLNAAIRKGVALNAYDSLSRRMKSMWRTSSFVGEPEAVPALRRRRETVRSSTASMATTLTAPQTTP